ncbi:MAG: cellulase N-terminal Ig-like domain-containing protein, partial [Ktedonobacterales bacterium]
MAIRRNRLVTIGCSLVGILALVATLLATHSTTHAAGGAYVRVNQVGYATTATKRAYLLASAVETGATFSL